MAKRDTLFTVAGITTHTGTDSNGTTSTRTKVRFGTDLVRVTKMLSNPKKIEDQVLGICLAPVRVDFVTLPQGMIKDDAIRHLMTCPEFQSAEDQLLLQESFEARQPREPKRTRKAKAAKADKAPSIDSLKARARKSKATVGDVLAAVAQPQA